MAPPRKPLTEYTAEAQPVFGCLLHPSRGAARRVYQLRHGELLSEELVCHTCDTPACIQDAHHFVGSKQDNARDAVEKGRHSCFQNCAVAGPTHPFYGGRQTSAAKRIISEDSLARWARVRALGLRNLRELAQYDAASHSNV